MVGFFKEEATRLLQISGEPGKERLRSAQPCEGKTDGYLVGAMDLQGNIMLFLIIIFTRQVIGRDDFIGQLTYY